MARLKITMVRVFLLTCMLYAMTGYTAQNIFDINDRENIPLLSRTLFLDLTRAGENIIAVGERGHILVSQDEQIWQQSVVPTVTTLTSVYFNDDYLGWAAGHDAVILKTMDGGKQWRQVYAAPDDEMPILDIRFVDDQYGIAIGAYGLYLVSTDGGETWVKQEMNIVNDGSINIDDLTEFYHLHLNSIAYSTSGKLYIGAEAGRIYRSDDLGKNWRELPSPYAGSFFGIQSLENDSVMVYGLRGHLYRSDDAGESWIEINTDTREHLTNSGRLHNGRILVTGMGGVLLISDDHGHSFKLQELGHRHNYAALIESVKHGIIMVGDHGIEFWSRNQLGVTDD
jgi:photosystem II stability/assembly factor-like uncharacterized protein